MKNLLLSTALVLATASVAGAAAHTMLANQVDNDLATMSINVDVNTLTEDQVNVLYQALQTEGTNERKAAVESALRDAGVDMSMDEDTMVMVSYPRSQLMRAVNANAADLGIEDVPLRALTDAQLTELYFIGNGSMSGSDMKAAAKAVLTN